MKRLWFRIKDTLTIPSLMLSVFLAQTAIAEEKQHPVNCATAEGDLRAIATERKHAEEEQAKSVIAITPAGALLGLVTGTEKKRLTMLSGDYIEKLNQRSDEIKSTCGIQ
ncbi:hypothetical protein [Ruegeria faecimaris]|uniref:hypothetical protein n=1 Tax=Ruegeria faecimaris TaxID=686389 RepID=UPI00248F9C49|nr:hypothetical protein [Ruegeria faecimaris]